MTSRMDMHEEREINLGRTDGKLTLDGMIDFIDFLRKEDINFCGASDILRLDLLKRIFEETKIEGSIRSGIIRGLFDHYKLVEQEFGRGSTVNKDKNIHEKIAYVRGKGKEIEPSAYYNTLASLTTYATLLYGVE